MAVLISIASKLERLHMPHGRRHRLSWDHNNTGHRESNWEKEHRSPMKKNSKGFVSQKRESIAPRKNTRRQQCLHDEWAALLAQPRQEIQCLQKPKKNTTSFSSPGWPNSLLLFHMGFHHGPVQLGPSTKFDYPVVQFVQTPTWSFDS
jgi:hypothetical protein